VILLCRQELRKTREESLNCASRDGGLKPESQIMRPECCLLDCNVRFLALYEWTPLLGCRNMCGYIKTFCMYLGTLSGLSVQKKALSRLNVATVRPLMHRTGTLHPVSRPWFGEAYRVKT